MQFFTYDSWQIENQYCDAETAQLFSSLGKVFSCQGERVVRDKTSEVIKLSSSDKVFYLKRFTTPGVKRFSFFRKSRIRTEAENLISLKKMGLPVPKLIASGERRLRGRFIAGALITEGIEQTVNLATCLSNNKALIADKKWLHSVIDQLAEYVRKMHKNKFVHRDLNLRNVLVQPQKNPAVYFIDCPSGGFRKGVLLEREITRDLAHLDKVARYLLAGKDLLRFYKKYKQINKLTEADKKFIEKIRHFHDKNRIRKSRKSTKPYRAV